MNQQFFPYYQQINNNIEQILLRIEQELIKLNKSLENNNTENDYLKKDDNLYIL